MRHNFCFQARSIAPSLVPFAQATAVYFVIATFITNKIVFSVFKCLPIGMLIMFVARRLSTRLGSKLDGYGRVHFVETSVPSRYPLLILIGLCSSLLGDICVVYKDQLMIGAIVTFGVAHCCYATAFSLPSNPPRSFLEPFNVPCFLFIVCIVYTLDSTLVPYFHDALSYAAPIYSTLIGTMCWRALSKLPVVDAFRTGKCNWSLLMRALGGLLFVASDGTLSYNLFVNRLEYADSLTTVMLTYYGSQLCFAVSIIGSEITCRK
jgi:uncharacterized membrane protein YhhN